MILACFPLNWRHGNLKRVPVMRRQSENPNSSPCENQVLCRLFIHSLATLEWNFCLLYSHFLQDGNERAVTDLTGTEKHQEVVPDKNAP